MILYLFIDCKLLLYLREDRHLKANLHAALFRGTTHCLFFNKALNLLLLTHYAHLANDGRHLEVFLLLLGDNDKGVSYFQHFS